MTELLKQPASSPFPVEREVVSIWAGTTGELDDIDVADIRAFEAELHDYIAHNRPEIFTTIAETGELDGDTVTALEEVVGEVKEQFAAEKQVAAATAAAAS
jgi:F-type H+-transporting ATPase subunit alpha